MTKTLHVAALLAFLTVASLGAGFSLHAPDWTQPNGDTGPSTRVTAADGLWDDSIAGVPARLEDIHATASVPVFGMEARMPSVRVGEPGAKIAPNGTIYVYAPGSLSRSLDGGATFQRVPVRGRDMPVLCGCDSDFAVDDKGNIQYADLNYPNSIPVGWSLDGGSLWHTNKEASGGDSGMDRQWIETDGKLTTYLTYREGGTVLLAVNPLSPEPDLFQSSLHSNKFSSNFRAGYLAVDKNADIAYLFYASGNTIRVDRVTHTLPIALSVKVDDFKVANTNNNLDSFPAGAVDDAGNVYAVWTSQEMAAGGMVTTSYYAFSTDKGATWSAPIRLNKAPATSVYPWAVGGKDGVIGVVYYGSSDFKVPGAATGDWYAYYNYITNAHSATPTMTEVVAVPHILKSGPICTGGTGCGGGTRNFLDYFGVTKFPDGRAGFAFNSMDELGNGSGSSPYIHFIQQVDGPKLE